MDVAALVLLVAIRPNFRASSFKFPAGIGTLAAGTAAVLIALTGVGWWAYGSPQAALARMRGEVLGVSPDHLDFGSAAAGQVVERSTEVRNWTDQPVRLVGGTSDCSCVTTVDLPLSIPPGEARPVTVRMKIPDATHGAFTRIAELWTDNDDRRSIRLQIGCWVLE